MMRPPFASRMPQGCWRNLSRRTNQAVADIAGLSDDTGKAVRESLETIRQDLNGIALGHAALEEMTASMNRLSVLTDATKLLARDIRQHAAAMETGIQAMAGDLDGMLPTVDTAAHHAADIARDVSDQRERIATLCAQAVRLAALSRKLDDHLARYRTSATVHPSASPV